MADMTDEAVAERPTYLYIAKQCPKCNGPTATQKGKNPLVFVVSCSSCYAYFSNEIPVAENDTLKFKMLPPMCMKEIIPV